MIGMINETFIKASLFHKKDGKLVPNDPDFEDRDDGYVMNKARYNTEVRKDGLISYSHPDLDVSFGYLGYKFDNGIFKSKKSVVPTLKTKRDVEFKSVNTAVSLDVITDNTVWTKRVTINNNIKIPKNAKYLELHFKIDSNVPLPTGEIGCAFKIGEVEIKEPMVWSDKTETVIDDAGEQNEVKWSRNITYTIKDGILIKRIPVEYLRNLPVYIDITITPGVIVTFEEGETYDLDICWIDATHFIISYRDNDDAYKGKVIAGSISGTTITLGTAVTFENGQTYATSVCGMDSTHFVVSFMDADDAYKGKVIAGTLSGTTITISVDTGVVFENGYTKGTKICSMDSTHFVIAFEDQDDNLYGKVIAGSLSGTTITITADSATTFLNERLGSRSICAMDPTHFIVAYNSFVYPGPYHGYVRAGSLSGTTITLGSTTTFSTASSWDVIVCSMDSSHFVIAYRDASDVNKGKAIAGSLSGTTITITADSGTIFESGHTNYVSICSMDDTYFVIAFQDQDDSYKGKVIAGRLRRTGPLPMFLPS